jgi:hypothetical protein
LACKTLMPTLINEGIDILFIDEFSIN